METGHGKDPCDPIGSVAKQKADGAVKNVKYVIQDAIDFFDSAKQDTSSIAFSYVSIEDYEISEKFLKAACENMREVKGTMKAHAVFSRKANSIWVSDTSCFCKNCFSLKFQIKYGFLFLISFVLFQSQLLLKGLLKFAQNYLMF